MILEAGYASTAKKIKNLEKASVKLDSLKFFMRLIWETKGLNNKKYIAISELLSETGKMLGGWQKQIAR